MTQLCKKCAGKAEVGGRMQKVCNKKGTRERAQWMHPENKPDAHGRARMSP